MDKMLWVYLCAAILVLRESMAQEDAVDLKVTNEMLENPYGVSTGEYNWPADEKRSSFRINTRLERLMASLIADKMRKQTAWK